MSFSFSPSADHLLPFHAWMTWDAQHTQIRLLHHQLLHYDLLFEESLYLSCFNHEIVYLLSLLLLFKQTPIPLHQITLLRFNSRDLGLNISKILNSFFDHGYDKRVRPKYGGLSFLVYESLVLLKTDKHTHCPLSLQRRKCREKSKIRATEAEGHEVREGKRQEFQQQEKLTKRPKKWRKETEVQLHQE